MSVMPNWQTVDRLIAATTQAGGKIPASVADVVKVRDAVKAWDAPDPTDLAGIISRGEMTAENAHQVMADALIQPNRTPADITSTSLHQLARRAFSLVTADADKLVRTLQPAHHAAAEKMAKAAEVVDAGTSAEQALQHPEGPAAWQALAEARRVLDAVDVVVDLLVGDFEVLGQREPWMHRMNLRHSLMYCATADNYPAALRVLTLANGSGGPRGGRWHHAPGSLALQLPSAAAALLDEIRQAHLEREAADYARTHGVVKTG
ncbi:hypothetical protein [[Mycobacterium] nativiensis]|uniref:DUF222 domain-containing protein n=1 Tax=[Mycobacterium] nativiensis TaxID=2855503 RepID=A0ABU5Y3I5_9MYCO|nr:hypothetical protein [Mycolicibacter sp. MYC340]MEB3034772.1 hypothetical protein [Mycolicibacter sp. MYC340]